MRRKEEDETGREDCANTCRLLSSQVQLPSYFFTKNFLVDNGYLAATSPWTYLASSSVSGVVVVSSTFSVVVDASISG